MNGHRLRVGIAVGFAGFTLLTGTAAANHIDGLPHSGSGALPSDLEVSPAVETNAPAGGPELAFTDEQPGNAATGRTLPFTGGDVTGLVLVGGGALALGAVMVRRSKTQPQG